MRSISYLVLLTTSVLGIIGCSGDCPTVSLESNADLCASDDVSLTVSAESRTGRIQSVTIQLQDQEPVLLCTDCASPFSTTHSFGTVGAGTPIIQVTAADSRCTHIHDQIVTINEDPTLICPDDIEHLLCEGDSSLSYADVQDRLQADWSHICSSNPPIDDDHPLTFPVGETTVTFHPVDVAGAPDTSQTCTAKVTVKQPNARPTVSLDSNGDLCASDDLSVTVSAESGTGLIQSVAIQLQDQEPVLLCTDCARPFSTTHSFGTVGVGTATIRLTATDSLCPDIQDELVTIINEDPTLICPDDIEHILGEGDSSLSYADVQDRLQADWSHTCRSNPPIDDDHPSTFPVGETAVTFHPVDVAGPPDMSQACTSKVTVKQPNGCSSFEGAPIGNLPDVWRYDRAVYTNLSSPYIVIDEFPRGVGPWGAPGDGIGELTVGIGDGVRVELPFPAGWAEVQYDVGHPSPVVITGFDGSGNPVAEFTSASNLNQNRRHFSQITGEEIEYLEVSGVEAAIHKVCFCHSYCLPGDVNIMVLPEIP